MSGMKLGRVGTIGRFRPLHNGSARMLENVCEAADRVIIGIGSANRYDSRNPFTAEEAREMIDLHLKERYSNYEFLLVPDFGHIPDYADGRKWREYVVDHFGQLDHFVTGNGYTTELLKGDYDIIHPEALEKGEPVHPCRGSLVRMEMAIGNCYIELIPPAVARYLESNGLVKRFRREFGAEVIDRFSELEMALSDEIGRERKIIKES
jgi:cytidyltransferase-like protein